MTKSSISLTTTLLPCCKRHKKVCVVCHFEWQQYGPLPSDDELMPSLEKWLGASVQDVKPLDARFVGGHLVIFFKAPNEFDTKTLVETVECAVEDTLVEHAVQRALDQRTRPEPLF